MNTSPIIVIIVWRKERGVFLCSVYLTQMLHVFSHPGIGTSAGRGMVMRGMKWGTVDRACQAFVQNVPAKPRVQTNCCILRHGIHVAPHIQLQLHCLYTAHSKSVAGDLSIIYLLLFTQHGQRHDFFLMGCHSTNDLLALSVAINTNDGLTLS